MLSMQKTLIACLCLAGSGTIIQAAPVLAGMSFFLSSNGSNGGHYWGY